MQYKFHLNNLRIAPRKVRLITNLIKKMPVSEAEAQLKFQSKRAAGPVLKLLKSSVASAVNNFNLSPENLFIFNIFADQGPTLKRFRPRAFGRAGEIQKKTSHITLILEEKIMAGAKKSRRKIIKKEAETEIPTVKRVAEAKEKTELLAPKEIKPTRKLKGFTKKIFRRKAIG